MAKQRTEEVTALDRIFAVIPPREYERPDLEQLFTLLDLAEAYTSALELKNVNWRSLRHKVMGMIADAFQWYQYRFQTSLDKKEDPAIAVLNRWVSRLPTEIRS